ncbi:MAG: type II CAAX prenyl endopeptidase Rce1 family protein [Candidatus Methylumidiphilus sp.]
MTYARLALLLVSPFAYLVLCAFAGALLAYPLHFVLPASWDYQTLVFKGSQTLMILGLIPLGRYLGMGWADVGLACPRQETLSQLRRGFGYGALMLGLHVLALMLLDVRRFDPEKLQLARIASLSAKGALIGLGVALIEEPVFRGFLLGVLHRRARRVVAVLVASGYFAGLHYLKTGIHPNYAEVRWDSGIIIVVDAFSNLHQIYLDSFLALFAAGAFLCCVRLLAPAKNFGYCLGIHAGWVFVIKSTNPLGFCNLQSPWVYSVSYFDGNIGYFSAAWTTVLIGILAFKIAKQTQATG